MRALAVLRLRLRSLFRRSRVEDELDRELRSHIEDETAANITRGMTQEAARLAAMRTFGGVESAREDVRDARGLAPLENLGRDLRYTLRGLRHQPMLLLAATLSIALGAGGNIAVFSLAKEFLLAAPDARQPDQLVDIEVSHGSHVSYQKWQQLRESGGLAGLAGYSIERQINWFRGDAAVSITPMLVTANFFDVTGVPVARGRGFTEDEAQAEGDPHLAVVSDAFWRRELGADPAAVGGTLLLNGESYTVLGVLAPHLHSVAGFGISPAVYLPLNRSLAPGLAVPDAAVVQLIGRLEPGQTLAQGRAAMDAADRRLGRVAGDTTLAGVQQFDRIAGIGDSKADRAIGGFFLLLSLVSFFVLLIACANVAGLLIARGTARRREVAIRLAIGGTRGRLLQQFLVEGFWLAVIGTLVGLGLSAVLMRVVNGLTLPIPIPVELHVTPDRPVLLWAVGLVVVSTLLCALLPALSSTRPDLVPALKREEPRGAGKRFTTRRILLAGQVTVSTVLLVTAFLFVRNLTSSRAASPGFEVDHALVAQVGFVQGEASVDPVTLLQRAVERTAAIPGVRSAAFANGVPLTINAGSHNGRSARIDDRPDQVHVDYAQLNVGPGYFATMGMRLIDGREFATTDGPGTPRVGIVNEAFARRYLDGADPVGHRVRLISEKSSTEFEIVGEVSDNRFVTIGEEQRAAIFFPLLQNADGLALAFVMARTQLDPASLVAPVRQAIGSLDRSVSVEVQPMRSALGFALLPSQVGAAVLGALGLLGLVLATFGLYAIVSYAVSRRIEEIAIRTALGATRAGIVRLVVRGASVVVGVGLLLGLGLAMFVTRPLAIYLVTGLSPVDPVSFVGTAAAFVLVTVLASWLPARQATRVSPVVAMRLE